MRCSTPLPQSNSTGPLAVSTISPDCTRSFCGIPTPVPSSVIFIQSPISKVNPIAFI
ncbi:MAG: hypothetical protein C00003105_01232 [ANME-2 cluster archaeon HR1]|nr:MAG: hypothetical protein C00003105_01232 [ANME-2 cluster archaeon HR1]